MNTKSIKEIQQYFDEKIYKIEIMSGGVTNVIYKVYTDIGIDIIRFYGDKSSVFIDRDKENKLLNYLQKYQISPKIKKIYNNCRIEEYKEGTNTCKPFEYQEKLCNILNKLHNIPIKNEFLGNFWIRFQEWKKKSDNLYHKEIEKVMYEIYYGDIKQETRNYWNQIVLGHGDLTLGNILVSEEINLIDFEYSCKLPRGFELANHLCEYEGLESEKMNYPNIDTRNKLIKFYLKNEYTDIDNLKMIDKFSLISHYYWGCWSIIQSKISSIDFDYKKYGENRFKMFLHYKKIFENENYYKHY